MNNHDCKYFEDSAYFRTALCIFLHFICDFLTDIAYACRWRIFLRFLLDNLRNDINHMILLSWTVHVFAFSEYDINRIVTH